MKQNTIMFFFLFGVLTSCSESDRQKDQIKEFIPGMYVAPIQTEYSKGEDTLRIGVFDEKANTYVISKHSGYNQIRDGIIQPKEYASQRWIAVYDESTHVLQELKSGKLFIFSPDNNSMFLGTAEYKKTN